MKSLLLIALFVGLACAAFTEKEYQTAFISWMKEHNKAYGAVEFTHRYLAFKWNMDYVEEWNSKGSETVLGLNFLADLTNAEYQRIYLGTHIDGTERLANAEPYTAPEGVVLPGAVDWRDKGAVTGVKDQGQCGSCWSFSATGGMEGAIKVAGKALPNLSEQNLMDCSTAYGNQGCNGGLMDSAFKYVIANKGIDTESSYPYETKQGACRYKAANIGGAITGFTDVAAGSEAALMNAVDKQPVSVAIDASHSSFQMYKTGVYNEAACSARTLDHGVLAIGYGTSSADYWLVKNSWGTSWGMQGYIQMSRNKNNQCGIATSASYPRA